MTRDDHPPSPDRDERLPRLFIFGFAVAFVIGLAGILLFLLR